MQIIKHKKLFYVSLFLIMVSIGFLLSKTMTGKVSRPENECKPDYLLEHVWYEDVDNMFAEARCKVFCWRDLHVDSVLIERGENITESGIEFIRLVCYCDQNDCG